MAAPPHRAPQAGNPGGWPAAGASGGQGQYPGGPVTPAPGGFALPPGGPTRPAADPRPSDQASAPSRRSLLVGTGVAVVAAAAGATWYAVAGPTPRHAPGETGYSAPSTSGTNLGPLADIPENGGAVFDDQEIVVTRSGSTVHGFSAVCTHQGCLVSRVSQGEITCPCHGSAFDATTGAVVRGPAQRPLPAVPVKVVNGSVVTG
jgi:Rieske Fe-S protein